ncbi:hypothetical protein SUGI_0972910 [Cryptomeria japonica]|uniref:transcriptional activator hap3 n=1 Tax=Cryptomeria japonica TaxID=3369 RepID=UPI002414A4C9|nr:transcriptional activator hap3 [Cryptomeria japonica]GLJ46191.1 hypothetical protein SUGI_0972910 [Cryptomeria japonica]
MKTGIAPLKMEAEKCRTNGREVEFGGEEEQLVPLANVGRIMRKGLPPNTKVSKEAKQAVQECVSEFIAFVTNEASDKCKADKRKTINGEDIIWAFNSLGFDNYGQLLETLLHKLKANMGHVNVKLPVKEEDDSCTARQLTTEFRDRLYVTQPASQIQIQEPFSVRQSTTFADPGAAEHKSV